MQRLFSVNFLIVFIFVLALGSCVSVKLRTGDEYYEQLLYKEAIPYYEYVMRKKYSDDVLLKLATSYRITKNYIRSEQMYKQVIDKGKTDAEYKLFYAEALMQNGKYAEAKKWFDKYLETNRLDVRVNRLSESCDSVHSFFKDTALYIINQLKLNGSSESNYSPAYYRQGIVFTSNRMYEGLPGNNRSMTDFNLFYAKKTEAGNWLDPEPLRGEVNSIFSEGPAVVTKNSSTAYVTRNNNDNIKIITNRRNENVLKIYRFELTGNEYKLAGEMPFNNNEYSVAHPTLSKDGNTMYFVADMPWGYGGTDIYQSSFVNGSWSQPKNLGKIINGGGNEMFPFLPSDSVLYFSSDGNFTLGGLDIYRSEFINNEWTLPENIGAPVNSSKDDFALIADSTETTGYFTSNRNGNMDKIFSYQKLPPVFSLTGKLLDKAGNKPLKNISLKLKSSSGDEITIVSNADGIYTAPLKHNTGYILTASEKGYFVSAIEFSTMGKRKSAVLSQNLVIEKQNMNKPYLWKGIAFDKGDSKIKPATAKEIDKLFLLLKNNASLKIELSCHTDSRGTAKDNFILSQKRADAIADILFAKGINRNRIIAVGYGASKLTNECRDGILCLEEEHQANIRTEVKILGLVN